MTARLVEVEHDSAVIDLAAGAVDDRRLEAVHGADELGDEWCCRGGVHLARRADLLDPAAGQDGDPVGDRQRLLLVVRDVEGRDPELELNTADLLAQLHAHLRIERRQRLVEQQHPRLDREGACERDALLHAAGELMRIAVAGVPETDQLEQLADRVRRGPFFRCRRTRSPNSTFWRAVMFGNRL